MKDYICSGYKRRIESDKIRRFFNKKRKISVIIPTYNEEENIKKITKAIEENIKKSKFKNSFEIIVVDDNSKDRTSEIIDELAKKNNFIALHRYKQRGLLSAINDGVFIANGDFFLTLDADFSHPPDLIPEMIKDIDKYDGVIYSRYVAGGGMRAPLLRIYGAKILNKMCILLAGIKVSDFGGQFRMFNKEKYSKIKFRYVASFAEYGLELFYRAENLGFKIKEIPFVYEFRKEGKSKMGGLIKLVFLGVKYLKMAFKLRIEKLFNKR